MTPYFAYGSNLWLEQMRERCPDAVKVGVGELLGYRWIIYSRGYANIVRSPGDRVLGVVYRLSARDEESMYRSEGVAASAYAKEYHEILLQDEMLRCLVYIDSDTLEGSPKLEYIDRINHGFRDAGLPDDYITRYIRPYVPAK